MSKKEISSELRLKALVQSLEWTYGVLWKLSSNERVVLEWVHGWFNSTSLEFGPTLAPQFYSIFKTCSFKDPGSQGYAVLALQRDCGPLWWTSNMPQIATDKCKAQFLQEARIQTIVCIPGVGGDGVQYCTELATTSLVPQMDSLMNSLQDYVSMSVITLDMFGTTTMSPSPSSSELDSSGQGLYCDNPLDSGTSAVAQMMAAPGGGEAATFLPPPALNQLHRYTPGDFNEALASSGAILRSEEPYFQWTALGNQSLFFDDQELHSGFFDDLDIDNVVADVTEKTSSGLFTPLQESTSLQAAEVMKPSSPPSTNLDMLNPYTSWDSNTFDPEEVVQQAAGAIAEVLPEFYASPVKSTEQAAASNIDAFQLRQTTGQDECASFTQNLAGSSWASAAAYHGSDLAMDVHDNNDLASSSTWPITSHFRHSQKSLFKKSEGKPINLRKRAAGGDDHTSPRGRQSLFRRWTEKFVPIIQEEAEREKLAEQQLLAAKSKLNPAPTSSTTTSGDSTIMRSSNPAHDEAAHIHKLAERHRRSKFNEKLHTICSLVPLIKKKDRVSILSHTIDYIHQLKAEVAELQEISAAGAPGGTTTASEKVQPLMTANVITISKHQAKGEDQDFEEAGHGLYCFGGHMDVLKLAVSPGNDEDAGNMVIKVEANNNQTQMLIQILTASRDLGLDVKCFNSECINNQMHITVTAMAQAASEHDMMSCEQVHEALQRVLVPFDNSPSSTITSGIERIIH